MNHHRQCELEKVSLRTTSWIPESFAKRGKILKLKRDDGVWDDGWRVVGVGARMTTAETIERSVDFKYQRKGSDI